MLEQRQPQRLQHAEQPPGVLAPVLRGLIRDQGQQPVQFERVNPQAARHPPEHPGAVIGGQVFGQGQAGIGDLLFPAAIGPAGPVGRIEQLAKGSDGLDAGQRIGAAHQPDQLPPALAFAQQFGQRLVVSFGRGAETGDHIDRIAKLLKHGIVRDRADLAQAHLAVGGEV